MGGGVTVDWDEVEAFYKAGNGYMKCGKHFNISSQTVRKHLLKRGVTPHEVYQKKVTAEEQAQPQPEPVPPTPKRRIIGINTKYEGR